MRPLDWIEKEFCDEFDVPQSIYVNLCSYQQQLKLKFDLFENNCGYVVLVVESEVCFTAWSVIVGMKLTFLRGRISLTFGEIHQCRCWIALCL